MHWRDAILLIIGEVRCDRGHRRYPRTVIEQLRSENS